ncbi:CHASE3 domain-containing protein [soil metagenome]
MTAAAPAPLDAAALDKSETTLRRNIVIALGVGLAGLLALIVIAVALYRHQQGNAAWVEHTYSAEAKISNIGTALERMETARRGYLLSPEDTYWKTYLETRATVVPAIDELQSFTIDNPRQQAAIERLRALLDDKLGQMKRTIEVAHAGDPEGAKREFIADASRQVTQAMRAQLADMLAAEGWLLVKRSEAEKRSTQWVLGAIVGIAALLAALGVGSWILVSRFAADLARSQTALQTLNAGLEDAVTARTAELSRANEELQRFAYIVSHDLRSPLVNVLGFTSELETAIKPLQVLIERADAADPAMVSKEAREAVTLDLPESIGFIRTSTEKMDRLINAILRLSREGRRTLTPERLNMNTVIASVIDTLRIQADARGAEVIAEGPLPGVESDRLAIEQVFANLLENAIKYLKPGRPGRVVVRGRIVGDRVVYDVVDNGRGIAPGDQQRVFDLFRRAGPQDQSGEGIGLAHVRTLVYRLGGLIDCRSELDEGATFSVSLPRNLSRELTQSR